MAKQWNSATSYGTRGDFNRKYIFDFVLITNRFARKFWIADDATTCVAIDLEPRGASSVFKLTVVVYKSAPRSFLPSIGGQFKSQTNHINSPIERTIIMDSNELISLICCWPMVSEVVKRENNQIYSHSPLAYENQNSDTHRKEKKKKHRKLEIK